MSVWEFGGHGHDFDPAPPPKPNWAVIGALAFCFVCWTLLGLATGAI